MIFCGLVGATVAGLLIDYTKWFKEIAAVSLCFAILCLIWFTEVSTCTIWLNTREGGTDEGRQ